MSGAYAVHKKLRNELEEYIKSQYFGKTPILLNEVGSQIDKEGILYQRPYIESSPAYRTVPEGIKNSVLPEWLRGYFQDLIKAGVGVYSAPFAHQVSALEDAVAGKDLFVATGTGSGKTECFMWPLMAKLAIEAKENKLSWNMRGVRVIVMYPMNALVSDQISRLRRLIGDKEKKFIKSFRKSCGSDVRRPTFGMYTGRTPYPGVEPSKTQDQMLERTLKRLSFPETEGEKTFFEQLQKEGKVPAKEDMQSFLEGLHNSRHIPNEEDAELITRFEMQQFCPDILITNYSMLEYMLLRPRENRIWDSTKCWLDADKDNKILFIIDEAHMYKGSAGGEVALLIRRLFNKLNITRDRVQFILTTASMPDDNEKAVYEFARDLTASDNECNFSYLKGEREYCENVIKYDIPFDRISLVNPDDFEGDICSRLKAINAFWDGIDGVTEPYHDIEMAGEWMFTHLLEYKPFNILISQCRGKAISLQELAENIFPDREEDEALHAVSVLLAIAPYARNEKGSVLFPARMHMLFRGIKGVYACVNPKCNHLCTDGKLTLGEILLSDDKLVCPDCGSVIYELYNDRRCGALFYKGYIIDAAISNGKTYLWHYPGVFYDGKMKEIHLYIPSYGEEIPKNNIKIKPCYLDVRSGFINFVDDSFDGKENIRKLYYCDYTAPGRPQIMTFDACPKCLHKLSSMQLSSFKTKGNQSFFNLIKTQFQLQPAVIGKDREIFPNEGRKVLLFSDSRQRAAKLARDMSDISDINAARQLFALALRNMEEAYSRNENLSMNNLYGYICLVAAQNHVRVFHGEERGKFSIDCNKVYDEYMRKKRRGREKEYIPALDITNAPNGIKEYIIRFYAGGYNTFYDSTMSWLEPTVNSLESVLDFLEDEGLYVNEKMVLEVFNAWILAICDRATALGQNIDDEIRLNVRRSYDGYGLDRDWKFSSCIQSIMNWGDNSNDMKIWRNALDEVFLDTLNAKKYVDLKQVRPRFDIKRKWYKCNRCSEVFVYPLKDCCPICGKNDIHEMDDGDYEALKFWTSPIEAVLKGENINVIDTEEHTAQLSHKDQRDDLWSKTEEYELRFQDLLQDGETPVDILSSTTTMEVGIDIGSLVAVGLRNIPPMRENYQQRAGRAGRRGASLSTIVTFCEDGPHDTLYFNNPEPMLRGEPRKPWIDITSYKLLQRHVGMVVFQKYLNSCQSSLDTMSARMFCDEHLDKFLRYMKTYSLNENGCLLPKESKFNYDDFVVAMTKSMRLLKEKRDKHPEMFGSGEAYFDKEKSLLDALYEEGIIPTYSFPKNVVSTYISDNNGRILYEVQRGLDMAIGEYAPGRSIVVDKQTYQIGGIYYPGSEKKKGQVGTPAHLYMDDPNYLKEIISCSECGWFGLKLEGNEKCPFCGNKNLEDNLPMLKPWGFAPTNASSISEAQLVEQYSYVQQPLYSTLPEADEMLSVPGLKHIRKASRTNQRIIMINKGPSEKGFMVCRDCGAAIPCVEKDNKKVLKNLQRPYISKFTRSKCKHSYSEVNIGYDFVTDMLVLEFKLDDERINTSRVDNLWLGRASQSLAEALRLAASKYLDVEFTELVTGYRYRQNEKGSFIDVYLYDSLSSGAGYAVSVSDELEHLLREVNNILNGCDCDSACYDCLKHYRNQHIHGMLDRYAALDLLKWGEAGEMACEISLADQKQLLSQLSGILDLYDCHVMYKGDEIYVTKNDITKKLVIYPAMWREPVEKNTIYVNDAYCKYAKPYALRKIIDNI